MMTNGDPYGRIFLSHPGTNNILFFFLTIIYLIFMFKERFLEVSECAKRHKIMTSL